MIHVRKMYKRIKNVREQQKQRDKNKCVLLKFPFFLTSFKDWNFPRLEVKFPNFSLTMKNFFPLTIFWPVAILVSRPPPPPFLHPLGLRNKVEYLPDP